MPTATYVESEPAISVSVNAIQYTAVVLRIPLVARTEIFIPVTIWVHHRNASAKMG